jgi:hypothetical protein
MNTLRQAVQEYLTMRRSLGFKLYKAGKLLPAFVKFMEEHHASYITTQLALAWAQQPSTVGVGETLECCPPLRAPSKCDRPTHADPPAGSVALSPQASPTISVQHQGNTGLIACGAFATRPRWAATLDLPLPVRITKCHGHAHRRSGKS